MNAREPVVFVVDDDPTVLTGISRLLRAGGLRSAVFPSAEEFLLQCDADAVGCLILNVSMPGIGGLGLQRCLHEKGIALPIVFLTGKVDVPATVQAMKGGAVDFLTKPPAASELLEAVNRALKKDQLQRQTQADLAADENKLALLTPREREVLEMIVKGHLNKQIAAELGMAERTAKFHRANLMEKLGAESIAGLVQLAARVGIGASGQRE